MLGGNSGKNGNFFSRSTLFQGTNDVVDCGDILGSDFSVTEVTLSAWIRPSAIGAVMDVIGRAAPFAGTFGLLMGVTSDGRLFAYFGDAAKTTQSASASQIATDTWYHIALTVRDIGGTYTGNIWLNGVKQGDDVLTPGTSLAVGVPFRIGSSYVLDAPDTARPFSGHVAQVTTWSAGMTAAEVLELRQGAKPGAPMQHSRNAALTHYWRMGNGDDSYPTILDKVGVTNGTCTGMVDAATNWVTQVP